MRIAPGSDGISIWSPEIFGTADAARIEEFVSRAFAVGEVRSVELRPHTHFGRIRFGAVTNPRHIWKKLSRALGAATDEPPLSGGASGPVRRVDARSLYLKGAGAKAIHISRVGDALSTWRVRKVSHGRLQLSHPVLRNRRDVVFRLEEELSAIIGVKGFRVSALTTDVTIRFDKTALTAEHLTRELEKAWPRLLDGLEGPPSRTRFVAAGALLVLAFTGQYLVPALRRVAVVGVLLYSLPNVVNGVKQLSRGEVGVYALYTAGVGFLLLSGLPFASTAIAVLMQFWPRLTRRKFVSSQRRLFARQRRRAVWARLSKGEGVDIEVSVDDLRKDDLIVVRGGETVPVDGFVQEGAAAVIEGSDQIAQRAQGDWIGTGTFVRDGALTIRVERTGAQTSASYLASLLPHAPLNAMPSLLEAERIANRNAKPTLALSALSLALTRTVQPAQAVLRPDYVTAPRLSAQLSALQGLGQGAQEGIFFRNPAALDLLARADVYVIDDTAGLDRRRVEVANIQTVNDIAEAVIAEYALIAHGNVRTDESLALAATASVVATPPRLESVRHHAGVTRFRDHSGRTIEVATAQHLAASKLEVPRSLRRALPQHGKASDSRERLLVRDEDQSLRPLWVLRDGQIIGVVSFARNGELVGQRVVTELKARARNKRARFVYLSRGKAKEADSLAGALGIELSHGSLDQRAKANLIRGLGRPTVWVGDGTDLERKEPIAASTVSISVAPVRHAQQDVADILLTGKGIDGLATVIAIGEAHASRLARDYRTVYAANLLGVGGALFARFNALRSGLVSNVGTGIVYARQARALDRLAAMADRERASLLTRSPSR